MNATSYVLTLSGSDSSGAAGMQADNRVIHAVGGMPLNVITACTLQTGSGLISMQQSEPAEVKRHAETLLKDYPVGAIKIGMVCHAGIVSAVAGLLQSLKECPFVIVDPVLRTSGGDSLLDEEGLDALNRQLLPLADLITPNLDEEPMLQLPASSAVLLKGGHSGQATCVDRLRLSDGRCFEYAANRVKTENLRGTGCALSAGIAAYISLGFELPEACRMAKALLHEALLRNAKKSFKEGGPSFL